MHGRKARTRGSDDDIAHSETEVTPPQKKNNNHNNSPNVSVYSETIFMKEIYIWSLLRGITEWTTYFFKYIFIVSSMYLDRIIIRPGKSIFERLLQEATYMSKRPVILLRPFNYHLHIGSQFYYLSTYYISDLSCLIKITYVISLNKMY